MSKQFLRDLHNNSAEEYLKLKRELSVIQKGKCMFCGNKLNPESDDCHITCTSSRRKFHIEDYILCHNECDADHKKTVLWEQSIKPVVVSIDDLDADKFDDDPFEKEFHNALKIIHNNCQIKTDKDFYCLC